MFIAQVTGRPRADSVVRPTAKAQGRTAEGPCSAEWYGAWSNLPPTDHSYHKTVFTVGKNAMIDVSNHKIPVWSPLYTLRARVKIGSLAW